VDKIDGIWKRMSKDPVLFANVLLPKKPHPGQITWLNEANKAINVLVPGNRWGKSTVIAMRHIWHNVFKVGLPLMSPEAWLRADYQTMSTAMSADQAEIVFREAKNLLNDPKTRPLVASIRTTPFPQIRFYNGAIMHCRSSHDDARYIDGHQYRFLSVDEAGWISELKRFMNNVYIMRLAGGGMIDLIGTPKGYGDLYFYYSRGERKVKHYYSQRGSIYDNPFLSREDVEMRDQLLASGNPKLREQVLYGSFVDFAGLAFTQDQMHNAFREDLRESKPYIKGHKYVTAWDLGRQNDFTVGITLDYTERPWRLVKYERLNKVAWESIYSMIERTRQEYHCRWATIDGTGPGGDVIEEEMSKRGIPIDSVKTNTSGLKVELINGLQTALDEGREVVGEYETVDESGMVHKHPQMEEAREGNWGILRMPPIVQLMDEMGMYKLDDKKLVQDSVFALALAVKSAYDAEYVRAPVFGGLYGSRN